MLLSMDIVWLIDIEGNEIFKMLFFMLFNKSDVDVDASNIKKKLINFWWQSNTLSNHFQCR